MADARERFWAGLRTELTFGANGLPQVTASAFAGSGITVRTKGLRLSPSTAYRVGCVLDVNIGPYDQAYAILHGELEHDDPRIPPYLLISWFYWEQDSEPVYQSDYLLDSSEVMPNDELDLVPISAVGAIIGNAVGLPKRAEECTEDRVIFWKRLHVYVSAEEEVMTIEDAARLPAYVRQPSVLPSSYQAIGHHSANMRAMETSFGRNLHLNEESIRHKTLR